MLYQLWASTKKRHQKLIEKLPDLFNAREMSDSMKTFQTKLNAFHSQILKEGNILLEKVPDKTHLCQGQEIALENDLFLKTLDLMLGSTTSSQRVVGVMWQFLQDKELESVLERLQQSTKSTSKCTMEYFPKLKFDVQETLDQFKKNIGECEQAWLKHQSELIETLTCLKIRGDVLQTQKKVALNQFQKLDSFEYLRNELHSNIDQNDDKIHVLKKDIETKKSRFELENEESETRKALDNLKLLVDTKTNDIISQIKLEQSLAVNPVSLNGDFKMKST